MKNNDVRIKGTLRKSIEIKRILYNESASERITREFEIVKENRKMRKTFKYYKAKKTNNVLNYTIVVREKRMGSDYYFVCMEGATRIKAMKENPRIKYLKCSVMNARKGKNEIKNVGRKRTVVEERSAINLHDYLEKIKEEHKRPMLIKSRMPIMGVRR